VVPVAEEFLMGDPPFLLPAILLNGLLGPDSLGAAPGLDREGGLADDLPELGGGVPLFLLLLFLEELEDPSCSSF